MERKELGLELERLADRFSEGWHEGIKIDALDIVLLIEAAQALAQPAQKPMDDVRAFLAAQLTCWHRLTQKESDELVALFEVKPPQEKNT